MGDDILSKDELDALMDGVRKGEVDTDSDALPPGEVRAHDFARDDRVSRTRLPALEQIQERTARQLRDNFFRVLRRRCNVAASAAQVETFGDTLNTLAPSTSVHVVRARPLRGNGLVAIDATLASTLVDHFFGGAGRAKPDAKTRELTQGELRVVLIAVREALAAFSAAWAPVTALEFDLAGAAANLQFATLLSASDIVCTFRLHVAFEGGEGDVRIVLPYAALEPIRHLLDGSPKNEKVERDERWSGSLRDEVLDAEIELSSNLVETRIRIGDFLKLRPGDVIPIDLPELVTLGADDVALFHARFGTAGGNNAVRVVEAVGRKNRDAAFAIREDNENRTAATNPKSRISA